MAAQREWYEKDYYKILGVAENADAKTITKAYRKLARDSHPDTHPGNDEAEDRFKEVSGAYDVLGDDAKRKEYDEVRRLGPSGVSGFGGGPSGGQGGYNFNVGAVFDQFVCPQGTALTGLKEAISSDDVEKIKAATDTLMQAQLKLGEAIYGAKGGDADGADGEAPPSAAKGDGKGGADNVVDADFEEVKDDKKKSA